MAQQHHCHDPLIGQVLDHRYRLENPLGSGTVGTVYRARDLQTQRPVAVKLWHGSGQSPQVRARFQREAEALYRLKHPNIVEVFRVGMKDHHPYVVMEFLEGMSLEDLLSPEQPLRPAVAFSIGRQLLAALSFAHAQGVVHRDLKPENIFVQQRGREPQVKLLDFGLAKFLSPGSDPVDGSPITMTGMVLGTPLYMPPEQAIGDRIDARADVYAAGCILYEMLAGQPPHLGSDFGELVRAHITAPVPRLQSALVGQYVRPELQELLDTAMAKAPEQRYADAGQMLAAMQALPTVPIDPSNSNPPSTPRPSAVTIPPRPKKANNGRMLVWGAAVGAVLIVAAATLIVLLR